MTYQNTNQSHWLERALVVGFAGALTVWVVWFATHIPWVALPESVSVPVILLVWLLALTVGCTWTGRDGALKVGIAAGFIGSVLGLLLLGSKLAAPTNTQGVSAGVVPSAALIAGGFVALGTILGAVAGFLASAFGSRTTPNRHWLATFALVCIATMTPLLVIGGLVTSTNSGMAVPDWPNTYGSNMFLYPLGPRVAQADNKSYEQVFFEHSHRLFGTLVGLSTLTLAFWTLKREHRKWVVWVGIIALLLVILQGVLGGVRVLKGSVDLAADSKAGRWYSMGHGVLAQLCFAVLVALSVYLCPSYSRGGPQDVATDPKTTRRVKAVAAGLMHSLILQLIFGAMYRHLRTDHALWAHIGFSFLVAVAAMAAGFMLQSVEGKINRTMARIGWATLVVTVAQLLLGWMAFLFGTKSHQAANVGEALLRTTHQANGALLLALATAGFVWSRQAHRWATARSSPRT